MSGIFISYRRDDTACCAGWLHDLLTEEFDAANVFFDVESIPPSEEFKGVIARRIALADVVLVLVGRRWTGSETATENRRIDDPNDMVRFEVITAVEQRKTILPILLDGATTIPQLPPGLERLRELNWERLDHREFRSDAKRVMKWLATKTPASAANKSAVPLGELGWPFSWFELIALRWGQGAARGAAILLLAAFGMSAVGVSSYYAATFAEPGDDLEEQRTYQRTQEAAAKIIEGQVVDPGRSAVKGATVTVRRDGMMIGSDTTDDEGEYKLDLSSEKRVTLNDRLELTVTAESFRSFTDKFNLGDKKSRVLLSPSR